MTKKPDYLIYDNVRRDSSLKPLFEACAVNILNGNAQVVKTRTCAGYSSYPCFSLEGKEILTGAILELMYGEKLFMSDRNI